MKAWATNVEHNKDMRSKTLHHAHTRFMFLLSHLMNILPLVMEVTMLKTMHQTQANPNTLLR